MELDPPEKRAAESKTFVEKMQQTIAKPGPSFGPFYVPDPRGPATIQELDPSTNRLGPRTSQKKTFTEEYLSTQGFTTDPANLRTDTINQYDDFGLPFLPKSFTFGIETKTDVLSGITGKPILQPRIDVDVTNLQSIVDVREVIDFKNPASIRNLRATNGIVRRDGTRVPWKPDATDDDIINQINTDGAVGTFTVRPDGKITQAEIPWKKALTARLSVDEDYLERRLAIQPFAGMIPPTTANRLMGYNTFTVRVDNYAEIDAMKIEAMRAMNAAMLEMSSVYPELADDRVRLEIIDYQLDTDPFGYARILSEYGRQGVKYGIFAPVGYMLAEGTQSVINTVNVIANSALYGVGLSSSPFSDDPTIPYITDDMFPPFSSARRNEAYDYIIPDAAENYMKRLAASGSYISYPTAQYLSRYQFGVLPNVLSQATEIIMPAAVLRKSKAALSTRDFNAFKLYYETEKKKGRNVDTAEFLEEFIEVGRQSLVSRGIRAFTQNKIINTFMFDKPYAWSRVGLVNRINAGRTLDEIARLNPEFRTPYVEIVKLRDEAQARYDKLSSTIVNSDYPFPTASQSKQLNKLEAKIQMHNTDALAELAAGDVAPFYRNLVKQENYMVIFAAAGSNLTQTLGGDPALGEGIGAITSLFAYGLSNPQAALAAIRKLNRGIEQKKVDEIEQYAQALSTADPVMAEQLLTKARYLIDLRNEAIDQGVPPELVRTSVAQLVGVAGIHGLEPSIRNIKPADLRKMSPAVFDLMELHKQEGQLLSSMREAFANLSATKYPEGSAAAELQEILGQNVAFLEASVKQREADFKVMIAEAGAKVTEMIVDGTEKAISATDLHRGEVDTFMDAYEALLELGIGVQDLALPGPFKATSPLSTVVEIVSEIRDGTQTRINSRINAAVSDFGSPGAEGNTLEDALDAVGQQAAGILPEGGQKVKGRNVTVEKADIPSFNTGHKLHQLSAEVKRGADEEEAAAMFRELDSQRFRTKDGAPVGVEPYVDGSQILDQLLDTVAVETGVPLLDMASGRGVSRNIGATAIRDLNYTSRQWFAARLEEGADLDEVISDTVENASKDPSFAAQFAGLKMFTGQGDAVIAAMYQRHLGKQAKVDMPTVQLSYNQLRRIDSVITEMGHRARQAGRDDSAYRNLSRTITGDETAQLPSMYDQFIVDDADGLPVRVDQLFIMMDGELVAVNDAVQKGKGDWMDHKAIWHDDKNMRSWMQWGKRDAAYRDADYPLGIQIPSQWFDWDKVNDAGYDIAGKFQSWRRGMGQRLTPGATKQLLVGDPTVDTAVNALRLSIGEWLKKGADEGTLSFAEQDAILLKIQETFVGVDKNGNTVQLFPNIANIIDDTLGYHPDKVPVKIRIEAEKATASAVKRQQAEWARVRDEYVADQNILIDSMKSYTGKSVTPGALFGEIMKGGMASVNDFKATMKRTRKSNGEFFTEAEINEKLGDMAVQAIEDTVFADTGVLQVNPRDPLTMSPVYDMDMNALSEVLGVSGPNQRAVSQAVESALGPARYKTAIRMFRFMSERQNSPLGGASLSGIPRRFSMESYISRFYAINRDVIGPQYVATESLIQRFRIKGFSLMQAALTDPELGELFIDMLESGKPLPPDKERQLFTRLSYVYVKFSETLNREDPLTIEQFRGEKGVYMRDALPGIDQIRAFPLYQRNFLGSEFYDAEKFVPLRADGTIVRQPEVAR